MNTLIIPCAGKSNRFPNMKPKYLLTHPDGELMIQKAMKGINIDVFDRVIITIVKPHDDKYEAKTILKQVFAKNKKVEICVLEDFTKSASETVYLTLKNMKVSRGGIVVKDSDNYVKTIIRKKINNFITGYDLHKHPNISNIPGKSFLIVNEQNIIDDIIEKKVVSSIISLGVYAFESPDIFISGYEKLSVEKLGGGEMFVSHVISYLISTKKVVFEYNEACGYEDWGTLAEWKDVQKRFRTYFIDIDGVLMKNSGQYGKINWSNNKITIEENINVIKQLQDLGGQIVIVTSRTEKYKTAIQKILNKNGIKPYAIITGLNHSARVVINDFAPTNPYPSAVAINIPRNNSLKEYFQ
ncbi:HAD hydrolase family protein [Endomicrobium proavitum]|uniref:Uncharacterized protein n=1 Tax=Endomicrobium proavitum TaxID=1408281 RepID=A0A0G3WMC0_9BACT|nr:HAD hydrolase family protein [Endomicrobium proavitum]AKL98629.1 hypothetical protein Epro_1250 [Endomicrobium proavitum]